MGDLRQAARRALTELAAADADDLDAFCQRHLTAECRFHVCAPIETLEGRGAVRDGLLAPLKRSFERLARRDEIFIGGANRRAGGAEFVAAVTHYVGTFAAPFLGLAPSGRLTFLRAGEVFRMDGDRIAEAWIILDLPDLLRQAGRAPFPAMLGTEMLFPGPATHDGVLPDGEGGAASCDLMEAMMADLHAYDPATGASEGQTGPDGYWAENMLWYGPGGIGSTYGWEGFVADHRAAFLHAFPDRKGGDHYLRIGDGPYAAASGWPSMTMTHRGDYLGVPATGRSLTLRVMDFYRCENGQIAENWVLLDYVDLFRQMGVDPLAGPGIPAARRGLA